MPISDQTKFKFAWPTLEAYMEDIDSIVSFALGIGIDDMPDLMFSDAYEDCVSPKDFCLEHFGILNGRIVDPDRLKDTLG